MNNYRKIIHIDMDAFYASIEQRDNPSLRGKPVIVGGDPKSRGVVAACSYEARAFGIHSAMSCSQARKLCPEAVFVRPRMAHYKEISMMIMAIFQRYTSTIEPISLDEAFLDVTGQSGHSGSATLLAREICREIREETNLTASAGVSYNKFLAKIASDINKPNGIATITPDESQAFIGQLKISKFFGVGKATEKKMKELGVATGADLLRYSRETLSKRFGKAGNYFYDIARGIDHRPVSGNRKRKSIGKETTFKKDVSSTSTLYSSFKTLAETLGETLQAKNSSARTLSVKIRYNDFKTITRSCTVSTPMESGCDIYKQLPLALEKCNLHLKPIRLIGLSLSKLTNKHSQPKQLPLPFASQDQEKNRLKQLF